MEHRFKYCPKTTSESFLVVALSRCLLSFDDAISKNDENNKIALPQFIKGETVIDMDLVEADQAFQQGRDRNRSMDLAFAVEDVDSSERCLVLVELKLNHIDVRRNLKQIELENKIAGSLLVLKNGIAIYPTFFFIFADDLIQQAINKLFRFYPDPAVRQTRKAETIQGLKKLFFDY
ncbi:hypothetical protein GCM10023093_23040 [Nemorincola caseinilytica]|uniref:Uncharacterized protein n=1 Tax=Nemorincola caseinilytica TaxID=2054315 RepID=A0ABP8NLI0_9BACT